MKEERMMILRMIDEGKISADEGVSLLKAVSKSSDTEEKLSKAAKQIKEKAADFTEAAKPVVKKAVEKGGELAGEVGDKIKSKINKTKDTCDCEGDIIETEDMEGYSFDYDSEDEEDAAEPDEEEKPQGEENVEE